MCAGNSAVVSVCLYAPPVSLAPKVLSSPKVSVPAPPPTNTLPAPNAAQVPKETPLAKNPDVPGSVLVKPV